MEKNPMGWKPKEWVRNGGNSKGGKTLPKVEEDTGEAASIYTAHTTRVKNWGPSNRRNEYAYTQRINQNEWAYKDGNWRETRNQKTEVIASIGGETHQLGFGEFAEYTYVEILT